MKILLSESLKRHTNKAPQAVTEKEQKKDELCQFISEELTWIGRRKEYQQITRRAGAQEIVSGVKWKCVTAAWW